MRYSYLFSKMADNEFYAWMAGFFDGEGCIYFPKSLGVVEISVGNTDRAVIFAIKKRVGYGGIHSQKQRENWKRKYAWRVRRYRDARDLLLKIGPYLTIKAAVAKQALFRIDQLTRKLMVREVRNEHLLELFLTGRTRSEVAETMGMKQANVNVIILSALTGRSIGRTKPTPIPVHLESAAAEMRGKLRHKSTSVVQ